MRPRDALTLLVLAALWGASFLFMRVAAPEFQPIPAAALRVAVSSAVLFAIARATRVDLELRTRWKAYGWLGVTNSAVPFALFAFAQIHLTASMGAILNATTPIFGALVEALWTKRAPRWTTVLGMTLAFGGVSILVGWSPVELTPLVWLSIGAALLGSLCYGFAANYTKVAVAGAPPLGMAVGSQVAATAMLLPFAPFTWPEQTPSLAAVACLLALAVFSTGIALALFYRLVVDIGPSKSLTVTFLTPLFAMAWAALFLGESITPSKLAACAVVLVGTGLVNGRILLARQAKAP